MNLKAVFVLLLASSIFSSCATIVGGSKYTANVIVTNNSNADIKYNGREYGTGSAYIRVPRNKANDLSFAIKQEGCEEQVFTYSSRVLRGWAIVGTLFTWTGYPLPIPYGLIVDLATGAVYKPDIKEAGIVKKDYRNFIYTIKYTGCDNVPMNTTDETQEKLIALKNLFMEGLISAEEYEREKKKILEKL